MRKGPPRCARAWRQCEGLAQKGAGGPTHQTGRTGKLWGREDCKTGQEDKRQGGHARRTTVPGQPRMARRASECRENRENAKSRSGPRPVLGVVFFPPKTCVRPSNRRLTRISVVHVSAPLSFSLRLSDGWVCRRLVSIGYSGKLRVTALEESEGQNRPQQASGQTQLPPPVASRQSPVASCQLPASSSHDLVLVDARRGGVLVLGTAPRPLAAMASQIQSQISGEEAAERASSQPPFPIWTWPRCSLASSVGLAGARSASLVPGPFPRKGCPQRFL